MAKTIGKFTTYSAQDRGRQDRRIQPQSQRPSSVIDDDDYDDDQYALPSNIMHKITR